MDEETEEKIKKRNMMRDSEQIGSQGEILRLEIMGEGRNLFTAFALPV